MFRYFRLNDPLRLFGILFILVLTQLPFLLGKTPFTIYALKHMMLGSKAAEGAVIYRDVFTHTAPFSAIIFSWLHTLADQSVTVWRVLALLSIFLQACIFNILIILTSAFKENTYTPALLYVTLYSAFFDLSELTPLLMAMPFILLGFYFMFRHVSSTQRRDFEVFMIGLMLALASLFDWTASFYILGTELALVFLTNTIFRRYLLVLAGAFIPLALVTCYYFWQDGLELYASQGPGMLFNWASFPLQDKRIYGIIGIVPLLYFLRGLKALGGRRMNYRQVRFNYIMFMMALTGAAVFMFSEYKSPSQLIVLIPPIAYFSNHFLLEIKKPVMAEVYFGFLFLALLSVNYLSYFGQDRWSSLFNFKPLLVQGITEESLDKKVWVIGEDFSPYAGASKASTPYLEWSIARNELTNLNFYDNLRRILMHFENDSPEVIYDQKNVMPELMERIPKLQDKYEKQVGKSVYLLKKKLPEQD